MNYVDMEYGKDDFGTQVCIEEGQATLNYISGALPNGGETVVHVTVVPEHLAVAHYGWDTTTEETK